MLLLGICVTWVGCVHHVGVMPLSTSPSSITIPRTLQATLSPILMEGPDHRPGIVLLEWSHLDLKQSVLQYLQQRNMFSIVSLEPADLTLRVATKLTLAYSNGLYRYRIGLQAEMSEDIRFIKSYHAEHTAVGSSVRWVTASDRVPIEWALQEALEDLMKQIESDRSIYMSRTKQPLRKPSDDKTSTGG